MADEEANRSLYASAPGTEADHLVLVPCFGFSMKTVQVEWVDRLLFVHFKAESRNHVATCCPVSIFSFF